nr:PREDICTED: sodium channel protein Nach-like isoform X2 [Tribolium castaneum]|eukprot:XP_015837686.1 PREDICTED: sodium channel protein Nach-like isoform X2 [Tribolium castaneum]
MILSRLKYYGKNTTLHGLKYVADEKRRPVIRLTWIAIFILSFYGMILVFKASYKSYTENAISFVTETAYLNWNTSFPAVTLCEITSSEVAWNGDKEEAEAVQQFIADLIFFTGSCYSCHTPCSICEELDFGDIVEKFRKKCSQLLSKCKWNETPFDCCEKFLPLETEYGICYSFNSLHTKKPSQHASDFYFFSNRKTGPGALFIQTIEDVRLYFHAREDVPFINSDPDQRKDVMLGETYNISINIIEIENDENVKLLPVEKRKCRFPEEKPGDLIVHDYYSYSTCVVQCHADAHIDLCNCTHHLMPVLNKEKYCDIEGLKCLTDNFETVNRLHAKGFDKPGLVCDCLPSCIEPEYKVVADTKGVKSSHGEIFINLQSLPTSRFKRIVVRTTMDLVVSIGGTAGLFIGASILSIVETIYLLCLRRSIE